MLAQSMRSSFCLRSGGDFCGGELSAQGGDFKFSQQFFDIGINVCLVSKVRTLVTIERAILQGGAWVFRLAFALRRELGGR